MANHVLILDDDSDFNSLLSDIFRQANYKVTALEDPLEAVDVFRDNHFDIVVTDHKMPFMSGGEFMRLTKGVKPEVPVIMISGFLENETIREYIGDGVGGVFLKPLNVFSLLERINELIEDAAKRQASPPVEAEEVPNRALEVQSNLKFEFNSFPCRTPVSIQFAERLFGLRKFKSCMTLVGERGTDFRAICEDIRSFDDLESSNFIYLTPENFDEAYVISMILEAQKLGADRVTCVLLSVESMSDAQKKLICVLLKSEGVFDNGEIGVRAIFCVCSGLDLLFDRGIIGESLYIAMGTTEVCVPTLNECRQEIPAIAQRELELAAKRNGFERTPILDTSAHELLLRFSFDGDVEQLRCAIAHILAIGVSEVIDGRILNLALERASMVSSREKLLAFLENQEAEYLEAVGRLLNKEPAACSRFWSRELSIQTK